MKKYIKLWMVFLVMLSIGVNYQIKAQTPNFCDNFTLNWRQAWCVGYFYINTTMYPTPSLIATSLQIYHDGNYSNFPIGGYGGVAYGHLINSNTLPAGSYPYIFTYTVLDPAAPGPIFTTTCTKSGTIFISYAEPPIVTSTTVSVVNCNIMNLHVSVSFYLAGQNPTGYIDRVILKRDGIEISSIGGNPNQREFNFTNITYVLGDYTIDIKSIGGCDNLDIGVNINPPPTLSGSASFSPSCNNNGNVLRVFFSGGIGNAPYTVLASDGTVLGSGSSSPITIPMGVNPGSVRVTQGGLCSSPLINVSELPPTPLYSVYDASYFYCDPSNGNEGTMTVQLQGIYNPGTTYAVYDADNLSRGELFRAVVSPSGLLAGRVAANWNGVYSQVFNVRVFALVNGQQNNCSALGVVDQKTQLLGVEIQTPDVCLTNGEDVVLKFKVSSPLLAAYPSGDSFYIQMFFTTLPVSRTDNSFVADGHTVVGNFNPEHTSCTFSITLNPKAAISFKHIDITHNASKCYRNYPINRHFMPKIPSPIIQVSGTCGKTYTGDMNLDPLICKILPAEWEIISVNNLGVATVLQTVNNIIPSSCSIPVNFNLPNNFLSLQFRHKLTKCSTPITLQGSGGVTVNPLLNQIKVIPLEDCSGYELVAPDGYDTYSWTPTNENTQSIFVTQAGTYSVTYGRNNSTCYGNIDSIVVNTPPIVLPLTANVLYTSCTTAQLSAVSGFDSYTWYDSSGGEVGQDMIFTTNFADTYTLVAMKGVCKKTLSLQVTFPQLQVFANPTATCAYVLQASTGFDSYLWSTGATTPNITVTSGTYTVTAIQGSCTQTASIHIDPVSGVVTLTINIPTLRMKNVLATSAATFSEQWLRTGSPLISSPSGFGNGGRGIWKPHETYAYITDRDRATGNNGAFKTPKVATDGIFNLNMFNWRYFGALNCSEWLKTQQITQYNPFNFEIENKDILDRYTAALYGYKNQLPIATVGNARVDEVAFESFEEYPNGQITSTDVSGTDNNLDLVTQSSNSMVNSYQLLLVDLGVPKSSMTEHIVYIKGTLFSTTTTLPIEVVIKGFRLDPNHPGVFIWKAKIVSYRVSSNVTELVLTSIDGEEPSCYWKGELGISKPERLAVSMNAIATLQDTHKHTGKKALKLIKNNGEEFFKMTPKRLHTIPGKKYVFSTWVKLANTCFLEGSMAKTELPKEEISKDTPTEETIVTRNSYPVASPCVDRNPARKADYVDNVYFTFENPGDVTNTLDPVVYSDVIEGWVRIEHEFIAGSNFVEITCYNKNTKFDILFMDDIRIHPFNSSLQTYVYDTQNYKLRATLDGNNFSSLYFYDEQGNLYLTKKETERGIQTIQESSSHQPKKQ